MKQNQNKKVDTLYNWLVKGKDVTSGIKHESRCS